ncbi:MAG: aminoacyl-tRNA hydrolase [Candidatus Vogelbacteria bacterium]|nr:aminoacyl-tRNA hydrolase [Candidatus Vogelbacteria bacterium]
MYIIAGLGNPGEEYDNTRHNIGREVVTLLANKKVKDLEVGEWKTDKKIQAEVATFEYGQQKGKLVLPNTFMNLSGKTIGPLITSVKKAESLVVIHDDLDLPLGRFKIGFDRGSGGHKGVESIIKNIKTRAFVRVRVGISGSTPTGKIKKPQGDEAVQDFVLGQWKPREEEILKNMKKEIVDSLLVLMESGRVVAMNQFN